MGIESTEMHLLHLEEVSARTRIPVATLRWMRHRGEGPPTFRMGRRVVAYASDVDKWIASCAAAERGGAA